MLGSLRLRFILMLDLRLARSTSLRMLPEDWRRRSSLCIPAFMVAAAASECGGVCEAGGECCAMVFGEMRGFAWRGVDEGEGHEGGSELRSGGIFDKNKKTVYWED